MAGKIRKKIQAFLEGMGSVLDIGATQYEPFDYDEDDVAEALRSDWENIGGDFARAMHRVEQSGRCPEVARSTSKGPVSIVIGLQPNSETPSTRSGATASATVHDSPEKRTITITMTLEKKSDSVADDSHP